VRRRSLSHDLLTCRGYRIAAVILQQNAPAMFWTRFQTAQIWGEIAMFELAGETPPGAIPPNKLLAVQKAAIQACDKNDGVMDGIIDDPRSCHFDASANICGRANAPAAPNCLTDAEATAVNTIWDGPRNKHGDRIWLPLDRGTDFAILDAPAPFQLGVVQFEWNEKDPSFTAGGGSFLPPSKWDTVTLAGPGLSYPQVAQDGSRNIADVTDTFGLLDHFKAHGGKMMTFVGGNDQFIYPRGVIDYYRQMAARYRAHDDETGFEGVQRFYRLFHAPGVGHCGIPAGVLGPNASLGDVGPWPQGGADFAALVNWVEKGVAPSQVTGHSAGLQRPRSRARSALTRRRRSMSARATSTTPPIGSAAAIWKRRRSSAPMCWCSTSTKWAEASIFAGRGSAPRIAMRATTGETGTMTGTTTTTTTTTPTIASTARDTG
jgi:tannase/feruloyl esterase